MRQGVPKKIRYTAKLLFIYISEEYSEQKIGTFMLLICMNLCIAIDYKTERTNIMSDLKKELQHLANINKDAQEFYQHAYHKVDNGIIKIAFRNLEQIHRSVVIDLQAYLRANGHTNIDTSETMAGSTREIWAKVMASVSNDKDMTFVKHLEEAEDRCLHKIQDIMGDETLPRDAARMLDTEYQTLRKSHDYMKNLKDQLKAA